jgi:hypothetical protein
MPPQIALELSLYTGCSNKKYRFKSIFLLLRMVLDKRNAYQQIAYIFIFSKRILFIDFIRSNPNKDFYMDS